MTEWNISALFESAARRYPDREAVVTADQGVRTFRELESSSNRLAGYLSALDVGTDDHVAILAQNCVEWIESALAAYRIGAAPVNLNYRYTERELSQILSDSEPMAVIANRQFGSRLVNMSLPPSVVSGGVVMVEDGTDVTVPKASVTYADCLRARPVTDSAASRTGDARYVMYTGGTTGSPKGVIWRHEDVLKAHGMHRDLVSEAEVDSPDSILELAGEREPVTVMALGQMMHANGLWTTLKTLLWGDRLVIQRRFDPVGVWDTVAERGVNVLSFVGDAMARPLVDELERDPQRWDLTSLQAINSAAAVLSSSVQDRFFELLPGVSVVEAIGTSETGMEGAAPVTPGLRRDRGGPSVKIGPDIGLVDDNNRLVPLRPGTSGRIARTGNIALRYHRDPEKTRSTFLQIDGRRWAVPGDYGMVVASETLVLKGRGSASINTGGEKVFAEEVESALKGHPAILDALVVGVPDQRWGNAVAALVQFRIGETASLDEIRDYCRGTLASYKLPRILVPTDRIARSPSGKPDYGWARLRVLENQACQDEPEVGVSE